MLFWNVAKIKDKQYQEINITEIKELYKHIFAESSLDNVYKIIRYHTIKMSAIK